MSSPREISDDPIHISTLHISINLCSSVCEEVIWLRTKLIHEHVNVNLEASRLKGPNKIIGLVCQIIMGFRENRCGANRNSISKLLNICKGGRCSISDIFINHVDKVVLGFLLELH